VTAVAPVLLSELFPTDIRYTAVSTSYQLAQTLGSGFAPLIAASLLAGLGGVGWVAGFLIVVALLSALAIRLVPETRGQALEQSDVVDGSVLNRAGEPA
jgi:MFS family permease